MKGNEGNMTLTGCDYVKDSYQGFGEIKSKL